MGQIYKVKEKRGDLFREFDQEYIDVDAVHLDLPEDLLEITFSSEIVGIKVPLTIKRLVDDFCTSYPQAKRSEVFTLIASSQNLYKNYSEIDLQDPLVSQFGYLRKDLSYFLDQVKEYQFGDRNFLNDLRFRFKKKNISNSFLFEDIFIAILKFYELDVDSDSEFEERRKIILDERTNELNYTKAGAKAKIIAAKAFDFILRDVKVTNNQKYTFIGVFFNCAQIPLEKGNRFLLSPIFGHNTNETSPKNIWNLLHRPPETKL